MPHEPRAVVFDLDDTLYPYRHYRASGFAAIALHLEQTRGFDARITLAGLLRSARTPARGREIQACIAEHALPETCLDELLTVFREHRPTLTLPASSAVALGRLRAAEWNIGVLTNGSPAIQRRKVDALRIGAWVDQVVFATEHGTGAGKPDPEPFNVVAKRLDVRRERIVFVGNDESCDIAGARGAGMQAVLCTTWTGRTGPTIARHVVHSLTDVPAVADALLEGTSESNAA